MKDFIGIVLKNYSVREAIRAEIEEDIGFIVRYLPGALGFILRYLAYKPLFGRIGYIPYIHPGVRFVYMKNIHIGAGALVNSNTYIYGKGGVCIGEKALISPNCSIVAGDHNTAPDRPIIEQPSKAEKIVIGRDSWIGANCVVVGGVTVGEGSIVGAGSVVTRDTEPYSINVGAPARKIGERK